MIFILIFQIMRLFILLLLCGLSWARPQTSDAAPGNILFQNIINTNFKIYLNLSTKSLKKESKIDN